MLDLITTIFFQNYEYATTKTREKFQNHKFAKTKPHENYHIYIIIQLSSELRVEYIRSQMITSITKLPAFSLTFDRI